MIIRWKKIRKTYYWSSYDDDNVERCDHCQRKSSLEKANQPMRPIPVKSKPFLQGRMDIVGPLQETNTVSS